MTVLQAQCPQFHLVGAVRQRGQARLKGRTEGDKVISGDLPAAGLDVTDRRPWPPQALAEIGLSPPASRTFSPHISGDHGADGWHELGA
jgi:hypothetical protein